MLSFDVAGAMLLLAAFLIEAAVILLERPGRDVVKDMKVNLLLGGLILLTGMVMKGVELTVFSALYSVSLFKPAGTWWLWLTGFLCCDFIHWFYHWLGHKTRIFWAAHVTHHSSKHFNLSTGWRTNFLHLFYRFLFWAPLCAIGFPPPMILFIESITAMQNFLVHTEKVGKLGMLDWLFNTPSNHRVHHGSNPAYIDKNLGGISMLFDHLFGSYAAEKEPVVYGITHNIHTHNPAAIIFHEFVNLSKTVPRIKGIAQKLRYLFSPPV